MSPQLSVQQLAAAIGAYKRRLASKQLECDALDRLRKLAPDVLLAVLPSGAVQGRANDIAFAPGEFREAAAGAVNDFLTAKINWLLLDVQEFELQIKMLESQQSGIIGAVGIPPRR